MSSQEQQPGGFIAQVNLPSPAPSSSSSSTIRPAQGLPHPRSKPLQPGSNKEGLVRRYVEERQLQISRRYVKKFGNPQVGDNVMGYKSFTQVCHDLDNLVNVLWLSGTPSLQIPFLLKVASDFTQYVRSFPPTPNASFSLLCKLDHCFSSLLLGRDLDSKEALPGFENGLRAGMTTTDMVRCRSLVEQTRVLMVEVLSGDVWEDEEQSEDDSDMGISASDTDEDLRSRNAIWDLDDGLHLDAARIYEHTIVQLGERLGDFLGAPILGQSDVSLCR